jgi:hypothetical protein
MFSTAISSVVCLWRAQAEQRPFSQRSRASAVLTLLMLAFGAHGGSAQDWAVADSGMPAEPVQVEIVGAQAAATGVPWQKYVSEYSTEYREVLEAKIRDVQSGRMVVITNISCAIGVTSPGVIANVRLRSQSAAGQSTYDYFVPTRTARDAGAATEYILNAQTMFIGKAGDTLYASATGTNNVSWLLCKVAGQVTQE